MLPLPKCAEETNALSLGTPALGSGRSQLVRGRAEQVQWKSPPLTRYRLGAVCLPALGHFQVDLGYVQMEFDVSKSNFSPRPIRLNEKYAV